VILVALLVALLVSSWSWGQLQESWAPDLARRLGCFACHSLKDAGGNLALSLDGVGARLSPEELQIALALPRQLHPRAKMPSYAYLPLLEQKALVTYLESLK
jgi:cbb3-type cytochrome oxidase cytochrome c subunit